MNQTQLKFRSLLVLAIVLACPNFAAGDLQLTTNGGFETGDTSGWQSFPSTGSSFSAQSSIVFEGSFAGLLDNPTGTSAAVIKQANLGIGMLQANQDVTISFWAQGSAANGGVHFAEFFTEIDGGGASSSTILGGGPLFLTNTWTQYQFTVNTGSNDISGGVTLQFAAVTGGDQGSTSTFFIDNVSVSVVPEPTSAILLGGAGLGLMLRRRRG